jgi:hypothetical protein
MEEEVQELLKIDEDYYFNLENITEQKLSILKKFSNRPALPIRKTALSFVKVQQENIEEFFKQNNEYDVYWDYFPFSNNLHVQQNFLNMAIYVPPVIQPENYKNNNNILKVYNSYNLIECYKEIINLSGQNEDKLILVSTKKYYVPELFTKKLFNLDKIKNGFYIIPHINIYADYCNLEGKFLCELTGTLIS